jgi:DNA-binding NtrC family response regulator
MTGVPAGDSGVHPTSSTRASQGYASAVPVGDRGSIRILVIDDDRAIREGCASVLEGEGYQVKLAGRSDDVMEVFRRDPFNIVLVDLFMTPIAGMEILKSIMSVRPETIVIMMTGNPSVHSSVEALRIGAWDYLPKPFSASHLQVLIGRAAYTVLDARKTSEARAADLEKAGNSDRMTLLGNSPSFRRVVELARKVARTNASVMLIGESGTGKEVLAQFVHRHSGRADKPLVALNCAAVPEHLLESEMFGHRKGSFTGADREKVGLIEVAHDGTFFLDELTEMPLTLQAKLLRVVQDGVLRRVGSEKIDATVDVRLISATNRDPRQAIKSKHLREDLFYRLNVFPIQLPPLRERLEDIPLLASHFLQEGWRRHHSPRDDAPVLSQGAIGRLTSCPWRGNVRELQNVIERLSVLAQPGSEIHADEISLQNADEPMETPDPASAILNGTYHAAKEHVLATFEREYLTRLMARAGGNMSRAARFAAVDRTTLYRLLERHHVARDPGDAVRD